MTLIGLTKAATAQEIDPQDAFYLKQLHTDALAEGQAYDWLAYMTQRIGGRLSGTPQAAAAVEYTRQMLDTLGMDSVWLQPCTVPHWERGEPEQVRIVNSSQIGTQALHALALGGSVGTGPDGLTATVIEVQSLDEVAQLGPMGALRGKIVFYNRPMDEAQLNTFAAYSGAVDQRTRGARYAARHGAVAVLVRSITNRASHTPHTGVTIYEEGTPQIPAIAISTNDADLLSRLLRHEAVRVYMRNTSRNLSPKLSYNVIGEIKGSTHPDEILLVGGHLDSWDVASGAHDDASGCVHAMEVIRLLRATGYRPKRTIRCVLFMNEENGQFGSKAYADSSNLKGEFHLAAIESDRGGFVPRGFTTEGVDSTYLTRYKALTRWAPLLEPYGLELSGGGSGADISRLKSQGGLLIGLKPDSQRYFDYHHNPDDGLHAVNRRELHLGAAAMASLIYLIDKYGLE